MSAQATSRDPRGFVTPDAFEVSADLLGVPLAEPGRRLAALLIDLVVIGALTLVTSSFALVLGVVAAVFFVRAGFKRTPVEGSVFGRAMRLSVGCLGVFIALVTALTWVSFGIDLGDEEADPAETAALVREVTSGGVGRAMEALLSRGASEEFQDAETLEEAERVARDLIEGADELGVDPEALRALLLGAVPEDASWASGAPALFDDLLGPTPPPLEVAADAALDTALLADTLRALGEVIAGLEDDIQDREAELDRAEDALEDATTGGIFGWLRKFVDVLGFGFGWASLYLTVALSTWSGRTVGKRSMGIRVVRLDGKPITWWVAFERAGGYAAGFATGLLGFAQVYWDANRQAIHDRIVGTVVVRDGAPKVTDWESAL